MPSPSRVPLSVLDLAVVSSGQTSADALADTTRLARRADELGYRRFWVAEHHNMPSVASTTPPVLIAHLAASTERIKVGSGGVMLPNHPPLVVAEQFAMLESLHPGRIDLGIGRAPGTDLATAGALRRSADGLGAEDFPRHLIDVMGLLGDIRGADGLWNRFRATPELAGSPEIILLGSSDYSARLAGLLGLPFSFAHHFDMGGTLTAVGIYRDSFEPSAVLDRPRMIVSANVLVAPTTDEAEYLSNPSRLAMYAIRTGKRRRSGMPSPAEAATDPDLPAALSMRSNRIVAEPKLAVEALDDLVAATGADELMITAMTHGVDERIRSIELLADAWNS